MRRVVREKLIVGGGLGSLSRSFVVGDVDEHQPVALNPFQILQRRELGGRQRCDRLADLQRPLRGSLRAAFLLLLLDVAWPEVLRDLVPWWSSSVLENEITHFLLLGEPARPELRVILQLLGIWTYGRIRAEMSRAQPSPGGDGLGCISGAGQSQHNTAHGVHTRLGQIDSLLVRHRPLRDQGVEHTRHAFQCVQHGIGDFAVYCHLAQHNG
mmetsp:Transcript_45553/g.120351  ORF Transcript_45553/g.120351 Transcript_45553/m.120351 type:complete len:212 (-) Transcript_45553:857-1492(-)